MSLHAHELAAAKRQRKPSRRNRPATVEQVSAEAMALAIELAEGDLRRLQVIDSRTVLVRNKP
jgi:hypothetical protein